MVRCRGGVILVWRLVAGEKNHTLQMGLFTGLGRNEHMPRVDGIETATKNTDPLAHGLAGLDRLFLKLALGGNPALSDEMVARFPA